MTDPISEVDILVPREPFRHDNTDEWPEFALSHASVHLPNDRNATVSLLEASAGFPLTVEGQLEPLDSEDAHLYRQVPPTKRPKIVLENVKTFSYGQYGDGSTAIWAAGRAGWFTLKPARSYKATYNAMVDAVNLLYYIADNCRKPRKKGRGRNATILPDFSAQELFEKYAAEELGSSDPSEGADKFYEHKDFIISCMLSGKEGLTWSKFPLYRHFYKKFPDAFATLRLRLEGSQTQSVPINEVEQHRATAKNNRKGSVGSASTSNTMKGRGRPRKNNSQVTEGDSHSDLGSLVSEDILQAEGEDIEVSHGDATTGKGISRRTRQDSTTGSTPEVWDHILTPTRDEDTDEETKLRARKNKSSLRPRASKATKSSIRKSGKMPISEAEDDAEPLSSPVASKRKYFEDHATLPPLKRRGSQPDDDEGIDIPTSSSVSADENEQEPLAPLSAALLNSSGSALSRLGHVPDRLHEDTWVCALDGCNHKVYAASDPESQRLIKEHYALHAYDDDERVQMVKRMQAPSLPAGHLMERVKMQAKIEGFPGSVGRQMASRFPMKLPALSLGVKQRY